MVPQLWMAAAVGARCLFRWMNGPSFPDLMRPILEAMRMEQVEFNGDQVCYLAKHRGRTFGGAALALEGGNVRLMLNTGPRYEQGCTPRWVHDEIARLNRNLPRVSVVVMSKAKESVKDSIVAYCEVVAGSLTEATFRQLHSEMGDALIELE